LGFSMDLASSGFMQRKAMNWEIYRSQDSRTGVQLRLVSLMDEPIKTPTDIEWQSAMTLEEWLIKMIEEKKENEVLPILKVLPLEVRERYRRIWKERLGR
jgi:hypothetical protein